MKVTLELIYEELQKLATKEELAELEQRMDRRFMRQFAYFTKLNKQTVEIFEARMDKQDDRINAILDKYEGRFDTHEAEITSISAQASRHETWIQRVTKSIASYVKLL